MALSLSRSALRQVRRESSLGTFVRTLALRSSRVRLTSAPRVAGSSVRKLPERLSVSRPRRFPIYSGVREE